MEQPPSDPVPQSGWILRGSLHPSKPLPLSPSPQPPISKLSSLLALPPGEGELLLVDTDSEASPSHSQPSDEVQSTLPGVFRLKSKDYKERRNVRGTGRKVQKFSERKRAFQKDKISQKEPIEIEISDSEGSPEPQVFKSNQRSLPSVQSIEIPLRRTGVNQEEGKLNKRRPERLGGVQYYRYLTIPNQISPSECVRQITGEGPIIHSIESTPGSNQDPDFHTTLQAAKRRFLSSTGGHEDSSQIDCESNLTSKDETWKMKTPQNIRYTQEQIPQASQVPLEQDFSQHSAPRFAVPIFSPFPSQEQTPSQGYSIQGQRQEIIPPRLTPPPTLPSPSKPEGLFPILSQEPRTLASSIQLACRSFLGNQKKGISIQEEYRLSEEKRKETKLKEKGNKSQRDSAKKRDSKLNKESQDGQRSDSKKASKLSFSMRFEVLETIEGNKTCVTRKVKQRKNGKLFFAKSCSTKNSSLVTTLKKEKQILKLLSHPGVIKSCGIISTTTNTHLMLKYTPGKLLHDFLEEKGPLQEDKAKEIIQSISKALKYCHEIGVAHRDLGPKSIMIDKHLSCVLINFSHSTCSGHKSLKCYSSQEFSSPEIWAGRRHCPKRADVWALGVLAYLVLCGKLPFEGEKEKDLEESVCKKDIPMEPLGQCSMSLKNFIKRCLEKNPEKRSTLKELLKDSWIKPY